MCVDMHVCLCLCVCIRVRVRVRVCVTVCGDQMHHLQGAQLGHVVEAGDRDAADVVVVQGSVEAGNTEPISRERGRRR